MSPDAKAPIPKKLCICCHEEFDGELSVCPTDGTPLSQVTHEDDLVGTLFDERYEILNVVGGGGMGLVYRAKHRFMNRVVAIKVLHKNNNSANELKRFQLEAQAASALSIPNIVTIYDFGTSPAGEPYMVMDFLDGSSLTEILDKEGRFSVPRAVNIFIQISSALAHAHGKGIIHRDIKPSNIVLVNAESQVDFVKIVDFGIAKLLDSSDPNSGNLTRTGEVFGSPLYMSPEQWRGLKLDARTDIYSLGSVMYRVLSGKNIFEECDFLQLMNKHASEMPVSFGALGVAIPEELESIVFRALAKDRDVRYQSMTDLMIELEQFKNTIAQNHSDLVTGASTSAVVASAVTTSAFVTGDAQTVPSKVVPIGEGATLGLTELVPPQLATLTETREVPLATESAKEQTVHIQIPKQLIKIGLAVSLLGGVIALVLFGSMQNVKKAPVVTSPTPVLIHTKPVQTPSPNIGAAVREKTDSSHQDRTVAEEIKKAKSTKSSSGEQHRAMPHAPHNARAISPTTARHPNGFTKFKSKLKGLFRKLDSI